MRNLRIRRDSTIGFIDPYIVFKDPLTRGWETAAEENIMMFLTEQKNKETILYPYGGE
jgi:hypothetical protein